MKSSNYVNVEEKTGSLNQKSIGNNILITTYWDNTTVMPFLLARKPGPKLKSMRGVQAGNWKLKASASGKEITESLLLITNSITPCRYHVSWVFFAICGSKNLFQVIKTCKDIWSWESKDGGLWVWILIVRLLNNNICNFSLCWISGTFAKQFILFISCWC